MISAGFRQMSLPMLADVQTTQHSSPSVKMERCEGKINPISSRDSAVLNSIFNPNLPYEDIEGDNSVQEIQGNETHTKRRVFSYF